ncbi:hypothetical protein JCGZ_16675 [Jatropha curcas]|uniref:Aminotransferase-like plant mobile domain-containing protein n=1 Tax=Jatropha curcas TaxID=180498 RepID=A0A067K2I1_JATCU|nr:hypothetical protein JCGZ_16675 [Jatropha curcas]
MKNRQPGIGDFRLLSVVRDMQMYHRIVFMMIMGEMMCWVRDIALHITNFNVHHRGHFDFGDNPTIRWTCPWWRIRLVTAGSMNLNYMLYASLDRSMAYFPDRISRQYGMIQRVHRIHDFESGPMTSSLLTNLAARWRNRNTRYLGQGVMQDTVTLEYVNWFYTL